MNFLIGIFISIACSVMYMTGSLISFSYADHGKPLATIIQKVNPFARTNLGVLPAYIAVKAYKKNFSGEGKHANLIHEIGQAKKGAVLLLWTPTCPKCKGQLKSLAALSKKHKKIKFIAVVSTFGDSMTNARAYWSKYVGNDHNMILIEDIAKNKDSIFRSVFAMTNQPAVPTTVFVNNKGKVLTAITGDIKWGEHGSKIMNCKFDG